MAKPVESQSTSLNLRGYLPALDGIRGLGILLVLLVHFVGDATVTNSFERWTFLVLNYGSWMMNVFFVLSGFLITGILYDARNKPRFFRNFYMRRVLKILPLYYGVIFVVLVVTRFIPFLNSSALQELYTHQWWLWFYGVNIYNGLQGALSLPYVDHFWSLSVEEQYYFVWPFVVWIFGKRPRALMNVCVLISIGAVITEIVASMMHVSPVTIFVLTPFRLDELCIGGFLAVYVRQPGGLEKMVPRIVPIAIVSATALVAAFLWNVFNPAGVEVLRPVRGSLITILLTLMMLRAITAPTHTLFPRFFCNRFLTFLGTISYGLYVYHHFISYYFLRHETEWIVTGWVGSHTLAVLLQGAVGMGVSVLISYVSYEVYEKYFLSLKRFFNPGPSKKELPRAEAAG